MSDPQSLTEHARANRAFWDGYSDTYQGMHGDFIGHDEPRWGLWQLPEDELGVLGPVAAKDVLELGCGAAQWAVALARRGARVTGIDNSARQLDHARAAVAAAGVDVELVHGSAESLPFAEGSFDVVFCDHGAMTFADPHLTVPEVARVLRPGGLFAFSHTTPLFALLLDDTGEKLGGRLERPLFGMGRRAWPDGTVDFNLPTGEWIRLFRAGGFAVEDMLEIRPPEGARSTYLSAEETALARRWPLEEIWKVRRWS